MRVRPADGKPREIQALVRIDTPEELTAFRHGGILPYVLRQLVDTDELGIRAAKDLDHQLSDLHATVVEEVRH